jgi:uncharacterized protein (DUF1499 family)
MRQAFARVRDFVVPFALNLSLLLPVYFMVAALGTKFGVWDWHFGLGTLTFKFGPQALMGAAGLGALAFLVALIASPAPARITARGRAAAFAALAIPAAGLIYVGQLREAQKHIPPIHDISTDWQDPPEFSVAILALRGTQSNPIEHPWEAFPAGDARYRDLAGKTYPEVQAWAYPDLVPIVLEVAPDKAFVAALGAARKLGLETVTVDADAGRIEAVATTLWFGFKDDVVIRVRADAAAGTIVDVRSVSRVGRSDLGTNAKRIRALRETLLHAV